MNTARDEHFMPESGSLHKLRSWWIVVFIIAVIGSIIPTPEFRYGFFMIDTLVHLTLFTILAFIPMIFFKCRKTTFLLAISMAPIGYLLENLHVMVTGDSFNAVNALANNAGVLAGIGAGFVMRLKSHYRRKQQ
jgi:hypothetical protein